MAFSITAYLGKAIYGPNDCKNKAKTWLGRKKTLGEKGLKKGVQAKHFRESCIFIKKEN